MNDKSEMTAFPFNHAPCPDLFASCEAFKSLQPVWNKVGDILKTQPPGTLAQIEGEWLVMAPMDDQLVLFCSPDLDGPAAGGECYLYRPQDHDFDDPDNFYTMRESLVNWLACPVYAPACALPEQVTECVRNNYSQTNVVDQASHWTWNGQHPAQLATF